MTDTAFSKVCESCGCENLLHDDGSCQVCGGAVQVCFIDHKGIRRSIEESLTKGIAYKRPEWMLKNSRNLYACLHLDQRAQLVDRLLRLHKELEESGKMLQADEAADILVDVSGRAPEMLRLKQLTALSRAMASAVAAYQDGEYVRCLEISLKLAEESKEGADVVSKTSEAMEVLERNHHPSDFLTPLMLAQFALAKLSEKKSVKSHAAAGDVTVPDKHEPSGEAENRSGNGCLNVIIILGILLLFAIFSD